MTNNGLLRQPVRFFCGGLAAVVGGGFGVDEEAAYFGVFEFEGAFEGGDDVVDFGHGEIVG